MSDARITELEAALAQAKLDHATEKAALQRKLTESLLNVAKLEEDVAKVILDKSYDYRTSVDVEVRNNDTISQLTLENNRLKTEWREMQTLLIERTSKLDATNEENVTLKEENDDLKKEVEATKAQLEEQDHNLAEAIGRMQLTENRVEVPVGEIESRRGLRPSGALDWDIESSIRQDRDLFNRAEGSSHRTTFSRRSAEGQPRTSYSHRRT